MDIELKYNKSNILGTVKCEIPVSIAAVCKGTISVGFMSYLGKGSEVYGPALIGRFCSIAPDVVIGPTNHPLDTLSTHLICFKNNGPFGNSDIFKQWVGGEPIKKNKVRTEIGHDVWIGRNVTIMRGVKIGSGSVIAAGSVVTKDVQPYSIIGGVPGKLIKMRFDKNVIDKLLAIEWWNYDLSQVKDIDMGKKVNSDYLEELDSTFLSNAPKLKPRKAIINKTGLQYEVG